MKRLLMRNCCDEKWKKKINCYTACWSLSRYKFANIHKHSHWLGSLSSEFTNKHMRIRPTDSCYEIGSTGRYHETYGTEYDDDYMFRILMILIERALIISAANAARGFRDGWYGSSDIMNANAISQRCYRVLKFMMWMSWRDNNRLKLSRIEKLT